MRPSRRVPNLGILQRMVSKTRLSVRGRVSGLTRRGILACQRARAHTFDARPNRRCHLGAISMIIENLSLGRMLALPGVIYKCGLSFMKRAFKYRKWETQTRLLIMSKRNTNL